MVRYLHPKDHHPARIWEVDTLFEDKLKNSIGISVFGYENKEKCPIYVSKKCCEEKHVDLLLIKENGKRHCVLVKDFNTFVHDHTLHYGKLHFCHCLLASLTEKILKCNINACFKVNKKQRIKIPKKRRIC